MNKLSRFHSPEYTNAHAINGMEVHLLHYCHPMIDMTPSSAERFKHAVWRLVRTKRQVWHALRSMYQTVREVSVQAVICCTNGLLIAALCITSRVRLSNIGLDDRASNQTVLSWLFFQLISCDQVQPSTPGSSSSSMPFVIMACFERPTSSCTRMCSLSIKSDMG